MENQKDVFLSFLSPPAIAGSSHELEIFNTDANSNTARLSDVVAVWTKGGYSVKSILVNPTTTNYRSIIIWLSL